MDLPFLPLAFDEVDNPRERFHDVWGDLVAMGTLPASNGDTAQDVPVKSQTLLDHQLCVPLVGLCSTDWEIMPNDATMRFP
jgi:hypothetical protein